MSRNDDLIGELHQARADWRARQLEMEEAREIYLSTKLLAAKSLGVIEEILVEIETGKSGRPLIDAVNMPSPGNCWPGPPPSVGALSGVDLVTSRPDSVPETNGLQSGPAKVKKASSGRKAKGGGE